MKKEMDKIADYLLLRSSYMQELGLFHGKMGVVVALYLYADAHGSCFSKCMMECIPICR